MLRNDEQFDKMHEWTSPYVSGLQVGYDVSFPRFTMQLDAPWPQI